MLASGRDSSFDVSVSTVILFLVGVTAVTPTSTVKIVPMLMVLPMASSAAPQRQVIVVVTIQVQAVEVPKLAPLYHYVERAVHRLVSEPSKKLVHGTTHHGRRPASSELMPFRHLSSQLQERVQELVACLLSIAAFATFATFVVDVVVAKVLENDAGGQWRIVCGT